MGKLLLATALATGGLLLFARKESQPSPSLVPAQTIVTVEARHGKDVPILDPQDVMTYERLRVTAVVPLQDGHAGLELFILLDDASSTSLGSQFGDLRQLIETQAKLAFRKVDQWALVFPGLHTCSS